MADQPATFNVHQLRAARLRAWPRLPELLDVMASALEAWHDGAQAELDGHLGAVASLLAELERDNEGSAPWE